MAKIQQKKPLVKRQSIFLTIINVKFYIQLTLNNITPCQKSSFTTFVLKKLNFHIQTQQIKDKSNVRTRQKRENFADFSKTRANSLLQRDLHGVLCFGGDWVQENYAGRPKAVTGLHRIL